MPSTDIPWVTSAAWDTLHLGPPEKMEEFPGLCAIKIKAGVEHERKKAKGKTGERLTIHGLTAADLDITLRIWTPAQLVRLNELFHIIEPSDDAKGKVPEPLQISHPTTTQRQVSAIVSLVLEGPNASKGPWLEYKITAIESIPDPPKAVGGTVKSLAGSLQGDIDSLILRKIRIVALRFGVANHVPRQPIDEVQLQQYQNEIDVLNNKIRENQDRLYKGNLPPTAPPPATRSDVTNRI